MGFAQEQNMRCSRVCARSAHMCTRVVRPHVCTYILRACGPLIALLRKAVGAPAICKRHDTYHVPLVNLTALIL